jgi:hypothetical protein
MLVCFPQDEGDGEEPTYLDPSLKKKDVKKVGCFGGVFVPTCENMWGVLIFLRFYFVVGNAGEGNRLIRNPNRMKLN